MKTIFNVLDNKPPKLIWLISALSVVALTIFNTLFSQHLSLEPLFILPILISCWYGNILTGATLSIIATLGLHYSQIEQELFSLSQKTILSALVCFGSYSFFSLLIINFRSVHREEVTAADTDHLTGLLSLRCLSSMVNKEIERSERYNHSFSMAFIDIDNFKHINDTLGHDTGDKLLCDVSEIMKGCFRKNDLISRIGGDEFVCLMPETDEYAAKQAFTKLINKLTKHVKNNDWPVSFSIGLVTFVDMPKDYLSAIAIADEVMYSVKNKEKDGIAYFTWRTSSLQPDSL